MGHEEKAQGEWHREGGTGRVAWGGWNREGGTGRVAQGGRHEESGMGRVEQGEWHREGGTGRVAQGEWHGRQWWCCLIERTLDKWRRFQHRLSGPVGRAGASAHISGLRTTTCGQSGRFRTHLWPTHHAAHLWSLSLKPEACYYEL